MTEPFLGEIQIFPYGFTPRGWVPCEGQLLQINQNQALYSILGNAFGGNGTTTFAVPDLRGRVPVHVASPSALGQKGGETSHTLTIDEMPAHNHMVMANGNATADKASPANNVWAAQKANTYGTAVNGTLNLTALTAAGGTQPHDNMQPYLALQFCIATMGIYPTPN